MKAKFDIKNWLTEIEKKLSLSTTVSQMINFSIK